MKRFMGAVVGLALAGMVTAANAVTIVDTGTPDGSINFGFWSGQSFGGRFSISDPYAITSIEGYFSNVDSRFDSPAGFVELNLHLDDGAGSGIEPPGTVLYSTLISLDANAPLDWYGAFGLNWSVDPGTYWVTLIPDSSIDGIQPGYVPNPMDYYVRCDFENCSHGSAGEHMVGFRIDAAVIPIPATLPLMVGGLGLLGLLGWRRKRMATA